MPLAPCTSSRVSSARTSASRSASAFGQCPRKRAREPTSVMKSCLRHVGTHSRDEPFTRGFVLLHLGGLHPAPAVLARPDRRPDPIDPHAAVGGLIEAFDEARDLRRHLLISPVHSSSGP